MAQYLFQVQDATVTCWRRQPRAQRVELIVQALLGDLALEYKTAAMAHRSPQPIDRVGLDESALSPSE